MAGMVFGGFNGMGLIKYKGKRNASKTPEPMGGKAKTGELEFVVQKHQASHLHYDFRLEVRNVLKSWAVPKGPSMDPAVKRLAMLVEDHPYNYKDFEGIIPQGNYGAGTVIIWDQGTYEPVEAGENKSANEKIVLKQFYSGKMKFTLKGKKLKGSFVLFAAPQRGENSWLLSKVSDKYAKKSDIAKLDKSVVSGKSIEQMTISRSAKTWQSNRKADTKPKKSNSASNQPAKPLAEHSNWRIIEATNPEVESEVKVDNCKIKLTDVDRDIWKGIPKATLIEYYHKISKYILPHLKDRPLSLHVKLNGAFAEGFYIKDMEGRQPGCAEIFTDTRRHPKQGKRAKIDYLVCNNEGTLLYTINLGCIDVNPWMSRTSSIETPDFINIDLDPSDDKFEKVIEVARAAKEVLDEFKLRAFPKSSGKTGMHIFVPVSGITFAEGRAFSEILGAAIHARTTEISTLNINKSSRGSKVLIDPSQNDYGDTLACAYSVRPNKLPTVSTPLEWREINNKLDLYAFTIENTLRRLQRKGDLFLGTMDRKIAVKNTTVLLKLG